MGSSSSRLRAWVSLLLAVAAGLGFVFPVEHGCRSDVTTRGTNAPTEIVGNHDRGHGSHQSPSPECMCVGDVCGTSVAVLLSTPILAAAPIASAVVVPIMMPNDRPVVYRFHVLPFANGPPLLL